MMRLVANAVKNSLSIDKFLKTYPRVTLNQNYTTIAGVIVSGKHSKPFITAAAAAAVEQ
jgi:hypothetical protein